MSQLLPGSSIGIIGGDPQISSIVLLAKRLGYRIHHFREEDEAKILLADKEVIGRYQDRQALFNFAMHVDTVYILTNAIEIDTIVALSGKSRYYQSFELAEISQNRTVEKLFLDTHAINLAPYSLVTTVGELPSIVQSIGLPAYLESNLVKNRVEEKLELYDEDFEERVLEKLEEGPCMLTAFVPAQRHFTVTVVRDYEDRVTVLPISEDVYITGKLKYSIVSRRLNPEWVQELKRIAFKIMDNLSGTTILSIQVKMGNNGIFYVDGVNQLPLVQQQFSSAFLGHSMSEILVRVATGLPIEYKEIKEEMIIVPIYESMMEKASLLTLLKPQWDFEFFQLTPKRPTDVLGVIRLRGSSSVDLLREIEVTDLFFNVQ